MYMCVFSNIFPNNAKVARVVTLCQLQAPYLGEMCGCGVHPIYGYVSIIISVVAVGELGWYSS